MTMNLPMKVRQRGSGGKVQHPGQEQPPVLEEELEPVLGVLVLVLVKVLKKICTGLSMRKRTAEDSILNSFSNVSLNWGHRCIRMDNTKSLVISWQLLL